MPSLTIRIRDAGDAAAIETLKTATHTTTASKALLRAAHRYPEERNRRLEAERRLETVRRDLDALRAAVREWRRAEVEARSALTRLETAANP